MASELYVETLKGLTSGANANKVVVPAGQQLIAPGHVIGFAENSWTSSQIILSTSVTDVTASEFTYTPKSDNSSLLILCNLAVFQEAPTQNGGNTLFVYVDGSKIEDTTTNSYENYHYAASTQWDLYYRYTKNVTYTNTSTTAKTIKVGGVCYSSATGNRLIISDSGFLSKITLMEIAG